MLTIHNWHRRKSSGVRLHEEMAKILSDIDKLKTTKKALQKQLDTGSYNLEKAITFVSERKTVGDSFKYF